MKRTLITLLTLVSFLASVQAGFWITGTSAISTVHAPNYVNVSTQELLILESEQLASIAVTAMRAHEETSEAWAVHERGATRHVATLIVLVLLQALAMLYLVGQNRSRKLNSG